MVYKKVLLPISVPDTDYCWDGKIPCNYFDNEGGHGTCELGMCVLRDVEGFYPKPVQCRRLINVDVFEPIKNIIGG